jgi:hypothetical protein
MVEGQGAVLNVLPCFELEAVTTLLASRRVGVEVGENGTG